jgi:hypothetical protein
MATRTDLFNCWSEENGKAFFLGHNKSRAENSVNMLMRIKDTPNIVQKKQEPQYKSVDLKYVGKVTLGMLPMKPLDLFPYAFQVSNATVEIKSPKQKFILFSGQHILEALEEMYSIQEILSLVKEEKIRYQLTEIKKSDVVNSDVVDLSLVYVYIVKQKSQKSEASGYKIWDKEKNNAEPKKQVYFYFESFDTVGGKKKKQVKKIKFFKEEKHIKITKWICNRMSQSIDPLATWLNIVQLNKERMANKKYNAEQIEYLQSLLGWALNSFVMMQRRKPQPRNIDYTGLLYADEALRQFT